jgi:hypothetical protein
MSHLEAAATTTKCVDLAPVADWPAGADLCSTRRSAPKTRRWLEEAFRVLITGNAPVAAREGLFPAVFGRCSMSKNPHVLRA